MFDDINKLKKIELHIHLDGSVLPKRIAEMMNKDEDEIRKDLIAKDKCEDLSEYLTRFDLPLSFMQTKENLELIAKDLVEYFEEQNVCYAEVRFAPMFHTKEGLDYDEIIEAVIKGLNSNPQVKVNVILCMMRGFDDEDNIKTIEATKRWLNKGVVALDLAGAEDRYPLKDYQHLFDIAKNNGIPFIIHAGENGDYEEVALAVKLGAKRIGHGIHAIDDEDTLNLIRDNNILLEVCPTSNVQTNSVRTYQEHPISNLHSKGMSISINTDNKTVSNVTLCQEYYKLFETFNFTVDDFKRFNLNALDASFLSDEEKMKIRDIL